MSPTYHRIALLCIAIFVTTAPTASAAPGQWSLGGFDWEPAPGGAGMLDLPNVMALHAVVAPSGFAYASASVPAGVTIGGLGELSFDVLFENGGCGGGSPRVQLGIDRDGDGTRDGNVFVYAGSHPFGSGCIPVGAWSHQDMLDGALRWDSSQLGGAFYGSREQAAAAAGPAHQIVSATFVYDSAWMFGEDVSVWFDNLRVDDLVYAEPVVSDACSLAAANGVAAC